MATVTIIGLALALPCAVAASMPSPLRQLDVQARGLAERLPAPSAFEVLDLSTGLHAGYNANVSMPAASTIKVAVMVEVFKRLEGGAFALGRRLTLLPNDKDWGSGDLCDAPAGTTYTISDLLTRMIDVSDNTAANMLIRFVGRQNINREMVALGLHHTKLANYIRTDDWAVRNQLRSSPSDMVQLLRLMAQRRLIDEWSSNEMIAILEQDQFNTLLPEPLPDDITIAHKTGSLFDTLDDVGIVYANRAPYVIAVMTTALPSQTLGRNFIHDISSIVYHDELRFAAWRAARGITALSFDTDSKAHANSERSDEPDIQYWNNTPGSNP